MTQLEKMLKDHTAKEVEVSYPDGKGGHTTTIEKLAKRFKDETAGWKGMFFHDLISKGEAHTRMGGCYKLKTINPSLN